MSARNCLLTLLLLASGCNDPGSGPGWDPGLQRMAQQPRFDRYDPNPFLPGGATLQPPVPGTVPRERRLLPAEIVSGTLPDGTYRQRIPIPIDRSALIEGQHAFVRWCTPCHGLRGDGVSFVATRMRRVSPADLLQQRLRSAPDGYLYTVISLGHGYMPSYAAELPPIERWQVVAFVRALQLSQHLPLEDLDAQRRAEIQRRLP